MKSVILLSLSLIIFIPVFGQGVEGRQSHIQQEKVDFFNKELGLSKAEADKFWPVYNDYQNRKNKLVADKRNLLRYYADNEKHIKSEEIASLLNKYLLLEKQETDLLELYTQKFRTILPDEKVFKIYLTEIKFKDYLLQKLRTR